MARTLLERCIFAVVVGMVAPACSPTGPTGAGDPVGVTAFSDGRDASVAADGAAVRDAGPDLATTPDPDLSMIEPSDLAIGSAPDLSTSAPSDLAMRAAPDLAMRAAPDLAMRAAPDLAMSPTPDLAMAPSPRAHAHRRCGWLFTVEPAAVAAFKANVSFFDAIHPVWYAINPDGVTVHTVAGVDDPDFLATARAAGVSVIPLVAGVDDASYTRTMLYDATKRAAHVQTLVALAQAHGYDGLELDYEHLWNDADAAPLAAFTTAFGAAMHAAGKVATMAVPALDGPSAVWSYDVIAASLDRAHVMAYDYHTIGSSHAGPTAPLGWIDGIGAYIASRGHAGQFLLGLPNYGVTTSSMCDLGACAARCTGAVSSGSGEMQSCSYNWQGYGAGRVNQCATAEGPQFFDDTTSLVEKAESAKAHGLGGIAYWRLGGEPAGFFDALRAVY